MKYLITMIAILAAVVWVENSAHCKKVLKVAAKCGRLTFELVDDAITKH